MAIVMVVALAAALLATLVVGASAATRKSHHVTRAHSHQTTARALKADANGTQGGGTVPVTG